MTFTFDSTPLPHAPPHTRYFTPKHFGPRRDRRLDTQINRGNFGVRFKRVKTAANIQLVTLLQKMCWKPVFRMIHYSVKMNGALGNVLL